MEFIEEKVSYDGDFIMYEDVRYVRATATLSKFNDFSRIDKKILERKTNIGTMVHKAIDADIKGDFAVTDPAVAKYFCSYLCFIDAWEPERILKHETRYGSEDLLYSGQVDLVMNKHGENILVDWKTSANESASWELQGHLYHNLLTQSGLVISDKILFVKLDRDGKYPKVFTYKFSNNILYKAVACVKDFWNTYNESVS